MRRREWLGWCAGAGSALAAACVRRDEPRAAATAASAASASASASASGTGSAAGAGDAGERREDAGGREAEVEAAPYPTTSAKETIADGELDLHDWSLPGAGAIADRAVVLVPRHLARGERVPLLIALHGLAETADAEMGAYAWVRRYGIGEGYARLRRPATITLEGLAKMATPARIAELQATLATTPFRGMVIACPYTPNLWKGSTEAILDGYARWLFDVLAPRLRAETPILAGREHVAVDGVSLGGYASLGVGLRAWDQLGAIGCLQAAVSSGEADRWSDRYAKAIASGGARRLNVMTSSQDVFREANEALDRALSRRGVAHDFRVLTGPHDQPFLRGPGSMEMLLWHDRALRG